ncbi:GntR family transcriptional regulator [Clostridium sp. CTA-7]
MEDNQSKGKLPLYIKIYDKILKNIQEGIYREENKLPNETKLAKQMGVSRMTLRQSLKMLQEDGFIESRKGVGNFLRNQDSLISVGLEQVGEVLSKCGIKNIDRISCFPRLDQSTLYTNKIFERQTPVVLLTNLFYYIDDVCYAHCFSIIPTDVDFVTKINMLNEEQVKKMITEDIYDYIKVAKLEIQILKGIKEYLRDDLKSNNDTYVLITEKMINNDGKIICINKYSIPMEYVDIELYSFKK